MVSVFACLRLATQETPDVHLSYPYKLSKSTPLREWIWVLEVMLKPKRCHRGPWHIQIWGPGLREGRKFTSGGMGDKILTSVYTIVIQYRVEDFDQKMMLFAADIQ